MRIHSLEIFETLSPFKESEVHFPAQKAEGLAEVIIFTGPNGTGKSRLLKVLAATAMPRPGSISHPCFGFELVAEFKHDNSETLDQNIQTRQIVSCDKHFGERISLLAAAKTDFSSTENPLAVFAIAPTKSVLNHEVKAIEAVEFPSNSERLDFSLSHLKNLTQRLANIKLLAAMENIDSLETEHHSNQRWLESVKRLEGGISKLTGKNFAIHARPYPTPQLFFKWGKDSLPLTSLPDGLISILSWILNLATLMDLAYPNEKDPLSQPGIFFIDEPETHLHPQWQRRALLFVQELFPNAQIFVATHSPFIVSSLNVGTIFKMMPDADGKVSFSEPIAASPGDSFISAAADILDTPEWYDPESESLLNEFRDLRDEILANPKKDSADLFVLAGQIKKRSQELANLIGAEMRQFEKILGLKN